ncbi:septal ring lytic transglycosylase RlpA family protein [Pasteurella atlantica]|uniref:Septal ring lytic transglycosylase RlpA family protein n=2 Tax=Pasteurellaceae TaxID=712 RepID=A0ACC6HLM2_9PAST|nr:septal ring lytic transglycosylase RlpA family protein [Pasteurella atlantica]MDP8033423.1 septal ring lytic transglycosylase RlpA family protein [Pasteurella atlantica]MDP8035359.1 septal ring lytic transglycosylase RlpA family protein [Pasteurella atlantica]MDP8037309.1 septal ring lytic transglycosylase RlpA family protein [Pasteurella atlantica]MDP8047577.1 septal ring lytic transglycosylase RlpA family protein [Pasteurella atlantica]MDP8049612.1 septal ring lytic transglycosylase RlpA 
MRVIKFFNVLLVAMMTMSTFANAKLSKNDVHVKGAKLLPSKVSTRIYSYRDRGYKYTTLSKEKSARYHAVGMASYYGGKFNGRKTASGEIFNENNFTAAHKTLAFGTYLLVTNLRNGRKIIVRVNDRGPFSKKRILDLSKRAARSLGMLHSGVAKVKVEALQVDQNGYISGKGTASLLKIAKKSGLPLKIKQTSNSTASIIVKVTNFESKDTAYEITRKVKPKTVIEKNGKYYDVLITVDNISQAKKLKNQLTLLTHNKVYIHYKK